MLLVVVEELILLVGVFCWFQRHLEAMCGLWWSLDIFDIAAVDFLYKVKRILLPCFLSALSIRCCLVHDTVMTHSLDKG